jgi:hypothetical protein
MNTSTENARKCTIVVLRYLCYFLRHFAQRLLNNLAPVIPVISGRIV